ncbi:MAG: transposase [bacterium]
MGNDPVDEPPLYIDTTDIVLDARGAVTSRFSRFSGLITGLIVENRVDGSLGGHHRFNNKIKVIKRQAFGFRDMDYFKLRIYFIHESRYALVG